MDISSLFVGLFALATINGTPQPLLTATSDAFSGDLDVQILVDSNNVAVGLRAISPAGTPQDYELSNLATGIVLYTTSGDNVVTITSTNFDSSHGGTFDVNYLNNGITSTYDDLDVNVEQNENTWQMLTDNQNGSDAVVTQAYLKANKVFGKTVGIESITLN
jgi:hypothetical protein